MPSRTLRLACALLALGACRRNQVERPQGTSSTIVAAAQDTGFGPATRAVQRVRSSPRGILQAAQATSYPGYDRVVFEFAGDSLPGYHVEYASGPTVRCGSGDPVALAGTGRLVVRFEPAQAHDERGNPTSGERESTPGLPALKDMKLVCDFEGQVEWVLGVAVASPYRVLEAAGPARLVLDVKHGP